MRCSLCLFLLLVSILFTSSCVSYSTLQTPKVLEKDEKIVGIGLGTPFGVEELVVIPELYARWAAFEDIDMGTKITGVPFVFGAIGLDVKYQVLNIDSSFYVSLDFGFSHSSGDFGTTLGYYPAIFLGNENIFGGAKLIIADVDIDFFGEARGTGYIKELFIGTSLGENFRVLPVINMLIADDLSQSLFLFNLGIEYKF